MSFDEGRDDHDIPLPDERLDQAGPEIECSSRLGGLLNFYYHSAA